MSTGPIEVLLQHVHQLVRLPASEETDRELLQCFQASHDESAFTAIVHRYGRLVLSVCQQCLIHQEDVEDAFQATFLILARKADSIQKAEALASWLYGVAYRVAMRTKQNNQKQSKSSPSTDQASQEQSPVIEAACRELQTALHEEVNQLPKTQQTVFILCCLEGRSKREAAEELGWKEGTVSGRLARARKRLQERLARRGFGLSAVLASLQLSSVEAGTVPLKLIEQAVCISLSDVTSGISSTVCTLAEGVMKSMISSNTKLTTILLFAFLLFGSISPGIGQGETPENKPQPKKPTEKVDERQSVTVQGIVIDPDGKPITGAKVRLWNGQRGEKSQSTVKATTKKDGRFKFTIKSSEIARDSRIIATATGYGPDWTFSRLVPPMRELKLQLVKDDVPIEGRILDLEGNGIGGVSISVYRVCKSPAPQPVSDWIQRSVKLRERGRYLNESGLITLSADALGKRQTVTTDIDGRFRLTGFGRDRVLRLYIHSNEIQHARALVVTRKGPINGWIKSSSFPLYPAKFNHLAAPCKPIVGIIRDKATGKPIPGVEVAADPSAHVTTFTDKQGRYKLYGVAKRSRGYHVTTEGGKGCPYFGYTEFRIADTPGLTPIQVNFELDCGIEITGKVINKTTGKPIRGQVRYSCPLDNPNLKNYPTIGRTGVSLGNWGRIEPDGSYTVLGIPGPGVLMVLAEDENGYPIINAKTELKKRNVRSFPSGQVHALVDIKVNATIPKSTRHDFKLSPSTEVYGTVLDVDGKPVSNALLLGLTKNTHPVDMNSHIFMLRGVNTGTKHLLIVLHMTKNHGVAFEVTGDKQKKIKTQLQELGSLEGQLIDEDGKPVVGRDVVAFVDIPDEKYVNVPLELFNNMGFSGLYPSAWKDTTGRQARTDKQGKFKLTGILPGLEYRLTVGKDVTSFRAPLQPLRGTYTVKPGKAKDVGKIKFIESPIK